jgi:hypothetical protein
MRWKLVTSVVLSAVSIFSQVVGLACASSGASTTAAGAHVNRALTSIAGGVSVLAIVLAIPAVVLAIMGWRGQRRWVRVPVLCVSLAALLWSLLIV